MKIQPILTALLLAISFVFGLNAQPASGSTFTVDLATGRYTVSYQTDGTAILRKLNESSQAANQLQVIAQDDHFSYDFDVEQGILNLTFKGSPQNFWLFDAETQALAPNISPAITITCSCKTGGELAKITLLLSKGKVLAPFAK
jgi:hypothetical protein